MKNVLVLLLTLVYFTSCSPEVDFVEPFTSDEETENENNPEENPEEEIVVSTDPCDFTLENAEAGETIIIDCVMDLGGKTIDLPSDITFEYDGGDIINGTLNFNNGVIDGRLFNSKLEIKGTANLLDNTFEFNPKRWDIVEGTTTSDVALKNTIELENLMEFVKNLGADTFVIGELDAYFEVSKVTSTTSNQNFYPQVEAVNVPSDFNLVMSDNTILRAFPTDRKSYALMALNNVSNVKITGGVLIGDRDEHDYSTSEQTPEWGHTFQIKGSSNVEIRGVKFTMAMGDGMSISGLAHYFEPDYKEPNNITVADCIFDYNARAGMSITGGSNLTIQGNQFLNSGMATNLSEGSNVGLGINVEAYRERNASTGELILYEKAHDIHIIDNIERNSRSGGFAVTIGENVTFEGNDMENGISLTFTSGSKVINNIFNATERSAAKPAIVCGSLESETFFNNLVSGNEIYGYGNGISVGEGNSKITNNTIIDCMNGINLKRVSDTDIINNTVTSSKAGSRGISAHLTWANNVRIFDNNRINVKADPLYFVDLNQESGQEDYTVSVTGNNFSSPSKLTLSRANGVFFDHNVLNIGIQLIDASKIELTSNEINTSSSHGVHLRESNLGVSIDNNNIKTSSTIFECIKVESTTNQNEVSIGILNKCL